MILVDSSIWVDHLRSNNARLATLLQQDRVLCHPYIIAELALGSLKNRRMILQLLHDLPQAPKMDDTEMIAFIERRALHSLGLGYVDTHLLASARLADALLWTRDRRLHEVAEANGIAF